ncbi:MAG: sulfide/dihydroorotate dehydrogenase-like FAD/NAD-binding protein [Phycisphaerae bacterium]|nr:sulfide/dihydroorotate dehydrogenase-like FAD/NAD-binding protein [Phycisphaerae bacterium]
MFQIVDKKQLSENVYRLEVQAPRIAKAYRPGQFAILRIDENGERIPLTIAQAKPLEGLITFIIQAIGFTTRRLCGMKAGEAIRDVAGPLGRATELERFGHVVLVGGGVGTAVIYPQAQALKDLGNRVTAVIGGRTKELVILEDELKSVCDQVLPCTDDGSYGRKGFVTTALSELIEKGEPKVDAVITAGPVMMMKAISDLTRPFGIKTIVSLNPIMVDGTGMCGGCRVTVGGKTLFACVEGPEFDGHEVDFKELVDRLSTYRDAEKQMVESHRCKLDGIIK